MSERTDKMLFEVMPWIGPRQTVITTPECARLRSAAERVLRSFEGTKVVTHIQRAMMEELEQVLDEG